MYSHRGESMRSKNYTSYIQSSAWRAKSKRCLSSANCCLFPWLKPRHAHHLTYKNLGKELLWRDVLPLSKTAHGIVHWWVFWNSGNPAWIFRIWMNLYLRFIGFPLALLAKHPNAILWAIVLWVTWWVFSK